LEKPKRVRGLFYEEGTTITTGVDELLLSQDNKKAGAHARLWGFRFGK